MWIDGTNGVAQHIDFALVAAADPKALRDHARERGWNNIRLPSAGSSTFKYDLGGEDADGGQDSSVSVFRRRKGAEIGTRRSPMERRRW
jgi:predicted dithiol-disulfide oxidoreductase (DUF899 family)